MTTFTRALTFAATVAAASAVAPAALADDSYSLAYSPAQITTEAGRTALHSQIKAIARDTCPAYGAVRSLFQISVCRADVVDDLVAKVNAPAFTAHVERERRAAPADLLASADVR